MPCVFVRLLPHSSGLNEPSTAQIHTQRVTNNRGHKPKKQSLDLAMVGHLVGDLVGWVDVTEDDAGAHGAVEGGVRVAVHPHEVGGTVVELVAVKVMTYMIGRRQAPESRTDERSYATLFIK